jgi:PIN domain nuclease of toxin-antitoxin system
VKIILDTHVTIWLDDDPGRLSQRAAGLIADPKNVVFLSVASIWEMQIKVQLGKLRLQTSVPTLVNLSFG